MNGLIHMGGILAQTEAGDATTASQLLLGIVYVPLTLLVILISSADPIALQAYC